jgi:AcrR family transcriptional regulator
LYRSSATLPEAVRRIATVMPQRGLRPGRSSVKNTKQAFGFLSASPATEASMAARQRQEAKSEASVAAVLDAGLELFSTQGYRATTLREIAAKAGLSVGNIYHHFPSKHAIYLRLIDRYWQRLLDPDLGLNRVFASASFPDDLEQMATAIEEVVTENSSHILLIYVDVVEFRGEHIRAFYEGMAERFRATYGERFAERRAAGEFGDADPMVAVMVAARWLFYFFTVEKCFGAPLHFGMTPRQAVDEFIRLLRYGLLAREGSARSARRTPASAAKAGARPRSRGGRKS